MRHMKKLNLVIMFVLVFGAEPVFPQASVSNAEIRGQVTDQNGAAVAGASVTAIDVEKGTTRTVNSASAAVECGGSTSESPRRRSVVGVMVS